MRGKKSEVVKRAAERAGLSKTGAERFLRFFFLELELEAMNSGTVIACGGTAKIEHRKARRALDPTGEWHNLPATARLVWRGPRQKKASR